MLMPMPKPKPMQVDGILIAIFVLFCCVVFCIMLCRNDIGSLFDSRERHLSAVTDFTKSVDAQQQTLSEHDKVHQARVKETVEYHHQTARVMAEVPTLHDRYDSMQKQASALLQSLKQ